uniref:Uncharacterized protein n=1 Tax=Zea mays TaxID=4577 RepID=B8A337_MAIZE|nr:unknown [Zea mays]ACR35594.1 unknown [Zea mays]ACR36445.1 unknown [Zea mays]
MDALVGGRALRPRPAASHAHRGLGHHVRPRHDAVDGVAALAAAATGLALVVAAASSVLVLCLLQVHLLHHRLPQPHPRIDEPIGHLTPGEPGLLGEHDLVRILGVWVQEVLEEPGAEDGDGALGEAALGPPGAALHHAELLQRALLPELVVDVAEAGPHGAAPGDGGVRVLAQRPARRAHLRRDRVPQTPELPRDGAQRQRRVRPRRPGPRRRLERRRHRLHLPVVLPVPLLHLVKHVEKLALLHLHLLPLRRGHLWRGTTAALCAGTVVGAAT